MTNVQVKTNAPAADKPAKAIVKGDTKVIGLQAKSIKAGLDNFNSTLLAEVKASGAVASSLEAIGGFLLAQHGAELFEKNSKARKDFGALWNDNYASKIIPKAPVEMQARLENQKGVYKGRALRFAAKAAIAKGVKMLPDQRKEADRLIAKYDANKARKVGKIEARGYKARMGEEVSALFKFHSNVTDFGGLSATKQDAIQVALESILTALGIDPASVTADKD